MIPRILHQSYRNQKCVDMCPTLKYCQNSAINLHKNFEYKFYDDDLMFNYIKTHFPQFNEKFNSLPKKIMKVDIFRYFLMYNEGGIYADIDYLFLKTFDMLDKECILMEEYTHTKEFKGINVSNCIFASAPKVQFWMDLLDYCFDKIKKFQPKDDYRPSDILILTGPLAINNFYNSYHNKNKIKITEKNYFNPDEHEKYEVINRFKGRINNTEKSTCSLIEDEEFLSMIEKFKSPQSQNYGIHLQTNSWISTQWYKYNKLFNGEQ